MKILLRIVDQSHVVLCQEAPDSAPELLPTRYDLYPYRGGVSWGYHGSGVVNLSMAIAARFAETEIDPPISLYTDNLRVNLLADLDINQPHDLNHEPLAKAINTNTTATE